MQSSIECAALQQQLATAPTDGILRSLARRIAATAGHWARNREQRASLARMDDRMLQDVGLDRAAAIHEADKWFWRQ